MRSAHSYNPIRASYVIRAGEDDHARPARMGAVLTGNELAPVGITDPRLMDPYLEELFEEALQEARRQGYSAGRNEGFEAGRQEGLALMTQQQEEFAERDAAERATRKERLLQMMRSVEEAIASALDYQAPAITELQETVSGLAAEVAAALVGHHLAVGDCTARDAVMRALSQVPRRVEVSLRLNPADLDQVQFLVGDITDWTVTQVLADPSVPQGSAIAHADNLEVDAGLDGALERVREVLAP